jgi:hypothetical protein
MSNISNRHTVNQFVAGKSSALTGQRLAKVGYKKTKENPNPLKSVCVSVPPIQIGADSPHIERLLPYINDLICTAQDGIIRSLYESSGGTLSSVSDEEISIDACINYLAAESAGARFSGESIAAWFDAGVTDNLTVAIADKLGFTDLTPENEIVIQKHVASYKDICKMLAGKGVTKNSLTAAQKNAVKTCVKLDTLDGDIGKKLLNKLTELEKQVDISDLLELEV